MFNIYNAGLMSDEYLTYIIKNYYQIFPCSLCWLHPQRDIRLCPRHQHFTSTTKAWLSHSQSNGCSRCAIVLLKHVMRHILVKGGTILTLLNRRWNIKTMSQSVYLLLVHLRFFKALPLIIILLKSLSFLGWGVVR